MSTCIKISATLAGLLRIFRSTKEPRTRQAKSGHTGTHNKTHKNIAIIHYSQTNYDNAAFQQALEQAEQANGGMIELQTGEASGSGYTSYGGPSMTSGQEVGKWEYDHGQKMNKYWDGSIWIFYDEVEKKEKYWDENAWQLKA